MQKSDIDTLGLEKDALSQSLALNKIVFDLLEEKKKNAKRLWRMFIVVCVLFAFCITGLFYELQKTRQDFMGYLDSIETVTTETVVTETTQTVEGDSAEINNVEGNQYKDNAVHNESAGGVD